MLSPLVSRVRAIRSELSSSSARTTIQDIAIEDWERVLHTEVIQRLRSYLHGKGVENAEKILHALYRCVQGELAMQAAHVSKGLTEDSTNAVNELMDLVENARFAMVVDGASKLLPPCADTLPLGIDVRDVLDPTLFARNERDRNYMPRQSENVPFYFPELFVACRGVGVERKSGRLLGDKIRAIEHLYLGSVTAPFTWIASALRAVTRPTSKDKQSPMNDKNKNSENNSGKTVRRIVPSVRLQKNLASLTELFLPTFSQEPTHEYLLIVYRELERNREYSRSRKQAQIQQCAKQLVDRAVNPVPSRKYNDNAAPSNHTDFTGLEDILSGLRKNVSVELYQNVPWGLLYHFFPTRSVRILPATRDLLRIDLLTLLGLSSAAVTYARDASSPFVSAALAGTVFIYIARIAIGLRQAFVTYRGRIARDKVARFLARDEAAVSVLAALAADERFAELACVWCSLALKGAVHSNTVRNEVLGRDGAMEDRSIHNMTAILRDWGFAPS